MKENPNIVVFGAGAVGSTLGGWLSSVHPNVWLIDLPPVVEALQRRGLTLYQGTPEERSSAAQLRVDVKAASSLREIPAPDLVIIAVKTYSLDKVARLIRDALGDGPLIVAVQNGVDNQTILPKYFSRVLYGIIAYNCWLDEPGVAGFQKRGPVVLGTPDGRFQAEAHSVAGLLTRAVETVVTEHFGDAVYSKMVINLTNSLQALIGHPLRPVSDEKIFQRILTRLTYEGTTIVRAAGYRECRLGGMPSWRLMWAAAHLPQWLTRGAFRRNVKKMVISSMAQDVVQRGSAESEIETLNGRLIALADAHGLAVPVNRAIYRLCRERFGKPGFQPLAIEEVWAEVQRQG